MIKHSHNVPPFLRYCSATIPAMFDDSMSYYEALCALWKWLQTEVVNTINNNATVTEQFEKDVKRLKDYVEHYFDNLDVQNEINNKLDQMSESGELAEIIGQYYNLTVSYENVSYIYPKNFGLEDNGDCSLIKAYGKTILVDTHREECLQQVRAFLLRNNVQYLDYVILSHYHKDHVGNFASLVSEGFIDNNTVIYLPAYSPLIESDAVTKQLYLDINDLIDSESLTTEIPVEGETLEIEDFIITFYNCETSIFTSAGYTDYNNCSTVFTTKLGNVKAIYTGDINVQAANRLSTIIKDHINLYKVEHHGVNTGTTAINLLQGITPDYAVQLVGQREVFNNVSAHGSAPNWLVAHGTKLLSQYENDHDIVFQSSHKQLSLKQGRENFHESNRQIDYDVYVDSSTTNTVQNGTQECPFKDLSRALSKIDTNKYCVITVHLADGNYSTGSAYNYSTKIQGNAQIVIVGNTTDNTAVTINNYIQLMNGANVTIKFVTLNTYVYATWSNLTLEDCIVNNTSHNYTVDCDHCDLRALRVTINSNKVGLRNIYGFTTADSCTFNGNSVGVQARSGSVNLGGNTYTNCTKETELVGGCRNLSQNGVYRKSLFYGTVDQGAVITLSENITNYRMLIFQISGAENAGQIVSSISLPFASNDFKAGYSYSASFVYMKDGVATPVALIYRVDDTDLKKISITTLNTTLHLRSVYGIKMDTSENK